MTRNSILIHFGRELPAQKELGYACWVRTIFFHVQAKPGIADFIVEEMGYVEMESDDGTSNRFYRTPIRATLISGRPRSSRTYWNSSISISFTVDKDNLDAEENRELQRSISIHITLTNLSHKALSLKMRLYQDTRDIHVAEITFLCSDIEHLSYSGDDEGVHSFLWATPQGCPAEADTWSIFAISIQGLSSVQRIMLIGVAFVYEFPFFI